MSTSCSMYMPFCSTHKHKLQLHSLHSSSLLHTRRQGEKRCVCVPFQTSVIIGKPRMKKEMQQARVKSALCFLRYFGNSSDTEVTMVSMVANWGEGQGKVALFPEMLGGHHQSEVGFTAAAHSSVLSVSNVLHSADFHIFTHFPIISAF